MSLLLILSAMKNGYMNLDQLRRIARKVKAITGLLFTILSCICCVGSSLHSSAASVKSGLFLLSVSYVP